MRFGLLATGAFALLLLAIGRHDDAPRQAAVAAAGAAALAMTLIDVVARERFPEDHGVTSTIGRWLGGAVMLLVIGPFALRADTALAGLAAVSSLVVTLAVQELAQRRRRMLQRELREADERFWIEREAARRRGVSRNPDDLTA